ncbi:hypothetical protein DFH94DRAFT_846537 [Russula ochroleuca]|uniref:Uncharacterized protein n=1 Tax=Russula ochroleuca TaxID=152965 RepID=A0A9P5K1M1_9AGAM|nr:hypothetical protein DFH94DRAFT_846537 [Russula ochroleuca]
MVPKSSDTTQVTLILGAKLLFCSASFLVIYNSIDALSDGSTPWGSFDLSHDLYCNPIMIVDGIASVILCLATGHGDKRTKYMKTIRLRLTLFLFPSSWEVTRQPFPLLQGTTNTGQSVYVVMDVTD